MKKLILLILLFSTLSPLAVQAQQRISLYTDNPSPTDDDAIYLENDPLGTPTGSSTKFGDFRARVLTTGTTMTLTGAADVGSLTTDGTLSTFKEVVIQISQQLPVDAALVTDVDGENGFDSTDNQFQAQIGGTDYAFVTKHSKCIGVEELAAADDDFLLGSDSQQRTITKTWCQYKGTGTTPAQISLEDETGNAMTHTIPTCTPIGTTPTPQTITAGGVLNSLETLRMDVDNAVSPETDTYQICFEYFYPAS